MLFYGTQLHFIIYACAIFCHMLGLQWVLIDQKCTKCILRVGNFFKLGVTPQVDFVMSQLSYFHLGHLTIKDSEPHITALYTLVEVHLGTYNLRVYQHILDGHQNYYIHCSTIDDCIKMCVSEVAKPEHPYIYKHVDGRRLLCSVSGKSLDSGRWLAGYLLSC